MSDKEKENTVLDKLKELDENISKNKKQLAKMMIEKKLLEMEMRVRSDD